MKILTEKIIKFRDDRDWAQFHNPKDLAISLLLEASELLENFQWKSSEEAVAENKDKIKDELADVLIYTFMISHELNIDIEQAVTQKLMKNEEKYPIDKAKSSNKKYNQL